MVDSIKEYLNYLKTHKKALGLVIILFVGLILSLGLVQTQQVFKSKAFAPQEIISVESQGQALAFDSQSKNYITSSSTVKIKLKEVLPSGESQKSTTSKIIQPVKKEQSNILPTQSLFGISSHVWWIDSNLQAYLDHFKALKVSNLRLAVDWKRFEKMEGKYDFSMYDRVLPVLNQAGFEIIGVFVTVPAWVSSHPKECGEEETQTKYCDLPQFREPQFRNAARTALNRYPFITKWEVGNEPELWVKMGDNLEDYLKILRLFYAEAKKVNPKIQVAAATLRGWDHYVSGMYEKAPERPWDAITFHPYTSIDRDSGKINPSDLSSDDPGTDLRTKEIEKIRAGMVAKEDGRKPIWITEYGWDRPPTQQAKHFNAFIKWLSARPWITIADIHMLHDTEDSGYGLTSLEPRSDNITSKTSLIPKQPFYNAFKDYPR